MTADEEMVLWCAGKNDQMFVNRWLPLESNYFKKIFSKSVMMSCKISFLRPPSHSPQKKNIQFTVP